MGLLSTTHIHQRGRTEYVPYEKTVTINEHRAPTDKSIQLLNEMQEKAKTNIIETIKIDNNIVKAIIICYVDSIVEYRMLFHIKFEINGVEYIIKDHIDKMEWKLGTSERYISGNHREVLLKRLYEEFSKMVTKHLLHQSNRFIEEFLKDQI